MMKNPLFMRIHINKQSSVQFEVTKMSLNLDKDGGRGI